MQEDFFSAGFVAIEGAMDSAFCESVVASAFARMDMDEMDRATWPIGRTNLAVTRNWDLDQVAPRAAAVLDELVGSDAVAFSGVQDNLIVNLPDPASSWWPPADGARHVTGWHKDGDWFRHFLDSPEQGLLVIIFWRDVDEDQGATYIACDSIAPIARLLADHPQGMDPSELKEPTERIIADCSDFRALTGRQGTIAFAHPFLVHTASVNGTTRPRLISNSSVMLREPMRFDRSDGAHSVLEQSILHHLGVDKLPFRPSGTRRKITSQRADRWRQELRGQPDSSA